MSTARQKAAFLDRDGVINVDTGYVSRIDEFVFIPGSVDALRRLQAAGYRLIVVTNQSGIARGFFDEAQFETLMLAVRTSLATHGVILTAIYHCPHQAGDDCECRKPLPGMITRACDEHDIDPTSSFLAGDKMTDIEAGRSAGVARCFLIGDAVAAGVTARDRVRDLAECVDRLLEPVGGA